MCLTHFTKDRLLNCIIIYKRLCKHFIATINQTGGRRDGFRHCQREEHITIIIIIIVITIVYYNIFKYVGHVYYIHRRPRLGRIFLLLLLLLALV